MFHVTPDAMPALDHDKPYKLHVAARSVLAKFPGAAHSSLRIRTAVGCQPYEHGAR